MVLPNVNIQSGIMPKAAMVLMAVMMMLRLMLPSNTTAHTLEAPPAGDTPYRKIGLCNITKIYPGLLRSHANRQNKYQKSCFWDNDLESQNI
nr:unnamed protein product [Callosobruchus analis]